MVGFFDSFPHQSTQPPDRFGRVRVLIVGNAGTGKTALAQYLATKTTKRPSPTVCCNTFVKLVDFPEQVGPDGTILRSQQYFVEFYDMGGHPRYRQLRRLFYKDISGVLLVHDLSNARSCTALHRWASEVAEAGSFSAPYSDDFTAKNVGGLPVPALVVGTKADLVLSGSAAPYAAILLPLAGIRAAAGRLMVSVEGAVRRALARLPLLHGMRRISSRASMLAGSSAGLQDGIEVSVKMRSHPQLGKLDAFLLNLVERRYYNGSKGYVDSNRRFPAAAMDSVGHRSASLAASALSGTPYAFQQDGDLLEDASAVRIDMV